MRRRYKVINIQPTSQVIDHVRDEMCSMIDQVIKDRDVKNGVISTIMPTSSCRQVVHLNQLGN
jgi:hypothetical protein